MKLRSTEDINGTSLQGYITISYDGLLALLGEPHRTDGDKTTVEWAYVSNKVVFTVYDYKTYGTPKNMYEWHIGGRDERALEVVRNLFPNHVVKGYRD